MQLLLLLWLPRKMMCQQLLMMLSVSLTVTTTLTSIIQQTDLQAGLGCVLA